MRQDLLYGLRRLAKEPGFTALAAAVIALAVAANTTIFSIVDRVLLRPVPFRAPAELVLLWNKTKTLERARVSAPEYLDWRQQTRLFDRIAAMAGSRVVFTPGDEPEHLVCTRVTADYFELLGVPAQIGRTLGPDDDPRSASAVAVLSDALWARRFGRDAGIIGKSIILDGRPVTVVGVMPTKFGFLNTDLWVPLELRPGDQSRDYHTLIVVARLRSGVSIDRAQAEMSALAGRLEQEYPRTNAGVGVLVEQYQKWLVGGKYEQALWTMFAAVGLVLLIACVNVANLLLGRSTARRREMAMRAALGAGRGRIMRQLLAETVVLSLVGGVGGVALAAWWVRLLPVLLPPNSLPLGVTVAVNTTVVTFALALSLLAGILFGLPPAWDAARTDLISTLKDGARGASSGFGGRRFRIGLVVSEVGLSAMLLAGSALLIRTLANLQHVDVGFRPERVLAMQVSLPSVRYGDADRIRVFFDRALEAVRTQPGVRSAAVATALPLRGPALLMHFEAGGRYAANDAERPLAPYQVVSPDYFAAMGISLRSGRSFLETDDERGLPVAIVNDAFARRFLEGHDPLKTHVRIDSLVPGHNRLGPRLDRVIVGVTTDVKVTSLGENGEPEIYVPLAQSPWPSAQFVVRTETEPLVAAASLRRAIQSIDPAQPVANVRTLDRVVRDATAHARFRALLLGSFAGIALLLIAVGVYGVISHAASQRRREFGIRIAIGGRSAQILWMIARHGLMMTGFGIVIGLGLSVIAMRGLSTFLFGVHPADPWIMAGVAVLLAAVGLAASLIPARRALRVDPIEVLRQD